MQLTNDDNYILDNANIKDCKETDADMAAESL